MKSCELIDKLGGVAAVSRLFGIRAPSVHAWKKRGIPRDRLIRLSVIAEERGIATRQELRPRDWHEIWPELARQNPSESKAKRTQKPRPESRVRP